MFRFGWRDTILSNSRSFNFHSCLSQNSLDFSSALAFKESPSQPLFGSSVGEKRCVTTQITAAKETSVQDAGNMDCGKPNMSGGAPFPDREG